jgi:uncharacterized protein (DUF2345 family)
VTLTGGGIEIACPGSITVYASKKSFVGPAHLSREMNQWPEGRFDDRFIARYDDGEPMRNRRYRLHRRDGAIVHGTTDAHGRISLQQGIDLENLRIDFPEEEPTGESP